MADVVRDEKCSRAWAGALAETTATFRTAAKNNPTFAGRMSVRVGNEHVAWVTRDGAIGYGRHRWRWMAEGLASRMLRQELRTKGTTRC